MIQMHCNGCDKIISRVRDRWLGADVMEPADDDEAEPADDEIEGEYRFHFCSEACMSAWAFGANFGESDPAHQSKGVADGGTT